MDVQIALNALTILDIQALALVDEAYQNRVEWIKKSISTTAKVSAAVLKAFLLIDQYHPCRWASSAPTELSKTTPKSAGCVFTSFYPPFFYRRLLAAQRLPEYREHKTRVVGMQKDIHVL